MEKFIHLFKALSEEIRLRIIALLSNGELCVCDLMVVLELPQSTVSRHLSYLKNSGWIEGERRGVWMFYRLSERSEPFFGELQQFLGEHLLNTEEGRSDATKLKLFLQQKDDKFCK